MSQQNQCYDGSCGSDHHHNKHHEQGCCKEDKCCCSNSKCCCSKEHEKCCFSDQLLKIADEAWMCLLKDKIKQKIQETTGQHLDQLASLVAASNHQKWNVKMEANKFNEDYKEKIKEFFNR